MIKFAYLENDIVTNISLGDESWKSQGWVIAPDAEIGYRYDPIDDAYIAPMPSCGHEELLLNEMKKWECSNEAHTL